MARKTAMLTVIISHAMQISGIQYNRISFNGKIIVRIVFANVDNTNQYSFVEAEWNECVVCRLQLDG